MKYIEDRSGRSRIALLGGMVLAMSCSEPASQADIVLAEEEAVFHQLCVCHEALSFASENACYTSFVARTPTEAECVRELFDRYEAEIEETVACQLDVIAAAQVCLGDVVDCDVSRTSTCLVDGLAARDACGPYVKPVRHGLDVCYGVIPDAEAETAYYQAWLVLGPG